MRPKAIIYDNGIAVWAEDEDENIIEDNWADARRLYYYLKGKGYDNIEIRKGE